jgi:hypothetical protein
LKGCKAVWVFQRHYKKIAIEKYRENGLARNGYDKTLIGLDAFLTLRSPPNGIAELNIPNLTEQIDDIPRNDILLHLWSARKQQKQFDLPLSDQNLKVYPI